MLLSSSYIITPSFHFPQRHPSRRLLCDSDEHLRERWRGMERAAYLFTAWGSHMSNVALQRSLSAAVARIWLNDWESGEKGLGKWKVLCVCITFESSQELLSVLKVKGYGKYSCIYFPHWFIKRLKTDGGLCGAILIKVLFSSHRWFITFVRCFEKCPWASTLNDYTNTIFFSFYEQAHVERDHQS